MFWNCYVAQRGKLKAQKYKVFIPEATTMADQRVANLYCSKKYDVPLDVVLCVPLSTKEMN